MSGTEQQIKDAEFAEWIKGDQPPSLTKMVKRYGSYDKVPEGTWVKFHEAMKIWQERRKNR
jgi:hypothetical protein